MHHRPSRPVPSARTARPIDDRPAERRSDDSYLTEFHREIHRLLVRSVRHPQPDDVAQSETTALLGRLDRVREAYPEPARYARVRVVHAAVDHDRRQAVQRSQSARLHRGDDGTVSWRREVISGDATVPGSDRTVFDLVGSFRLNPDATAEAVVGRHDLTRLLDRGLVGFPASTRALLVLVHGHGYTVTAAAHLVGLERTSASKLITRAVRHLRDQAGDEPAVG